MRFLLSAALAGVGVLALVRSVAAGLGGDGRAQLLTAAAAAFAFAAGGARARPLVPRAVAALAATLATIGAPLLEAPLGFAIVAAGGSWRSDFVTLLLAAVLTAFPCAELGALAAQSCARRVSLLAIAGALSLALLDAPIVPLPIAILAGCAAPWILLASPPRAGVPPESGRGVPLAPFVAGAAAALTIVLMRIEIASFLRGLRWEISQGDIAALLLVALGSALVGPALRAAGSGGAAIGAGLAAAGVLLSCRRLAVMANPNLFKAELLRFGGTIGSPVGVDGVLYPAFMTATGFCVALLLLGAALRAAIDESSSPRRGAAAALGLAAGLTASVFVADDGGLLQLAGWAAAAWGAAALATIAMNLRALATSIAGVALAGAGFLLLSPVEFRPLSLFPTERRMFEIHRAVAVRESVDGIALLVEEPDRRDEEAIVRSQRVRVDRTARSPKLDEIGSFDLQVATAAGLCGKLRRVLLVAPTMPSTLALLRRAGAERIDAAPLPAIAQSVAAAFGATELSPAGPDGLRPAAGLRGYDLIVVPSTSPDPADVAASLRPSHVRALASALGEEGVLAFYVDAIATPAAVAERLIAGCPEASLLYVADGLRAPALGLIVQAGASWGLVPSLAVPPIAVDRNLGGLRTAATVFENYGADRGELLRWLSPQMNGAIGKLVAACGELESASWTRSPSVAPVQQKPIPQAACDLVVEASRETPGLAMARAAYRQLARLLAAQQELSRLRSFAAAYSAADGANWTSVRDEASALRQLLDPDGALALLERAPAPKEEEGIIALAIEKAACKTDLGRGDEAAADLKVQLTRFSTSEEIAAALVETYLRLGKPEEALPFATHADTLGETRPSGSRHFVDRVKAASRPRR